MGNLTVVVPFYNGHQYIDNLINSIPVELPVLVIDDMSEEPLPNWWEHRDVTVVRSSEKGYFTGAVNLGIKLTDTDILVLNQDTWFRGVEWLNLLEANRKRYAMIGERISGTHPSFGSLGYIHGTFMFLRRDALKAVGLLDARRYPLWGSTAEYQWRVARSGFEILPLKEIPGFNHARSKNERYGSSIRGLLETEKKRADFFIKTPPLVSVIVPCYNYGRYLNDCINSLFGGPTSLGVMSPQTLQSFEVIIVNDASTDDSAKYVDALVSEAKGVRGFHLAKNVGTAKTLNFGIDKAQGKYITFLSADDMRESWSLESLVEACEANPHSFAYDDVMLMYKHSRTKEWRMQDYDFERLIYKNHIHAGIMFPKVAWEEVGGYPGIMDDGREDWAFNVALGVYGWCGVHVEQFGYLYRREEQNRSLTNTSQHHHEIFLAKLRSLFPEIYGGYRPMACCGKGGGAKGKATTTANLSSRRSSKMSTTTTLVTGGATLMATDAGSKGSTKLEYLGKQTSSIWDGPVTQVRYRFGIDRKVGWVDNRDIGVRGESGFLKLKDRNGNWLFRVVASDNSDVVAVEIKAENEALTVPEDAVSATVVEGGEEVLAVVADPVAEVVSATVSVAPTGDWPDPNNLYPSDIKRLNLTREQWQGLYQAELAGKKRSAVITYVEEKLASE